jgi:hypothetical protein
MIIPVTQGSSLTLPLTEEGKPELSCLTRCCSASCKAFSNLSFSSLTMPTCKKILCIYLFFSIPGLVLMGTGETGSVQMIAGASLILGPVAILMILSTIMAARCVFQCICACPECIGERCPACLDDLSEGRWPQVQDPWIAHQENERNEQQNQRQHNRAIQQQQNFTRTLQSERRH